MGSLERRIRNCMVGVSEPFARPLDLVELELYLVRGERIGGGTPAVQP
jgi:hypothetical protein